MWKGAAEALKARPAAISAIAATTSGSSVKDDGRSVSPIAERLVDPVAPNSSVSP